MFELRHLRYFVAVAEEGAISRAAAKLHLTQPALGRQIKALEEEIGQCLLSRTGNAIRLTAAGTVMLGEARAVLERADQAARRMRAVAAAPPFRIGYSPTLTAGLLAPAVMAFSQLHARVRVDMRDLASCEMITALANGELDIVVTVMPAKPVAGITWHPLLHQQMKLALAKAHPLAARKSLGPADLAGQRLVLYTKKDYPDYWESLAKWFGRHRVDAMVAGEYDGVSSLLAAVEAGLGIAIVAERTDQLAPAGIVFRPIKPGLAPIPIAAGVADTHRDDPRVAVFLAELARAAGRPAA